MVSLLTVREGRTAVWVMSAVVTALSVACSTPTPTPTPSGGGVGKSSPTIPSSSATAPAASGPARPVGTSAAASATASRSPLRSCSSETVTAAVLAALAAADGRPEAAELPGYTFVGGCGTTSYAVTALAAGPLATAPQRSAFDAAGPSASFFREEPGSAWISAGRSGAPFSCAAFDVQPGLRADWGDCAVTVHPEPAGPPAVGDQTSCRASTGARTFVHLTGVDVAVDGSATLRSVPQDVRCGGPNDLQYSDAGAEEDLHLLSGAPVGVSDGPSGLDRALPVSQLAGYLQHPESGIFEVFGDTPGLVTGLAEQFTPH